MIWLPVPTQRILVVIFYLGLISKAGRSGILWKWKVFWVLAVSLPIYCGEHCPNWPCSAIIPGVFFIFFLVFLFPPEGFWIYSWFFYFFLKMFGFSLPIYCGKHCPNWPCSAIIHIDVALILPRLKWKCEYFIIHSGSHSSQFVPIFLQILFDICAIFMKYLCNIYEIFLQVQVQKHIFQFTLIHPQPNLWF